MSSCREKALLQMPILTYGTTLLGAYCKLLKLTNTKTSDKRNGRLKAQSMNQGSNALLQAIFYIPTARQQSIATHTDEGRKGGYYSASYLKNHIMQCPCILVWFWDSRFTKLLEEKKLGSLPVSMHFAEKHNIDDINLEYGNYNPTDSEVVIKHKDLRPEPDYIILSSDSSAIPSNIIKRVFFPNSKLRMIITTHRLMSPSTNPFEKYVYTNRNLEIRLRQLIMNALDMRGDIHDEWKAWINKIKFFMNESNYMKLNVRM